MRSLIYFVTYVTEERTGNRLALTPTYSCTLKGVISQIFFTLNLMLEVMGLIPVQKKH
jgi:hypothetical protein